MGLEATCRARMGGRASEGKARLEESEVLFSGDFRFKVGFKDLSRVEAGEGKLQLEWPDGKAVLDLGDKAERWAEKIRNPPSLIDKLGIKPGARVSVIGIDDRRFLDEVAARTKDLSVGRTRPESDLIFVGMDDRGDLPRLEKLQRAMKKDGAVWVVWPKGRPEFREDDVRAYGPRAKLVDVKVVRFSDALSALKMMIPRAQR